MQAATIECYVCHDRDPDVNTCESCGRMMCAAHTDHRYDDADICRECAAELEAEECGDA